MAEPARVLAFGSAPAAPRPAETARVLPMPARGRAVMPRVIRWASLVGAQLGPPTVTIFLLLVVWQLAASSPTSALPSPRRWSSSITQAIVAVLPVPVAPRSVCPRFPARSDSASSAIALGWSPVGR